MSHPALLSVGGCRSGKSRLALEWALRQDAGSARPCAFIATANMGAESGNDPEMRARVARHQAERGPEWITLEAPQDPASALQEAAKSCRAAVIDCVTLWLSNLMFTGKDDRAVLDAVAALAGILHQPPLPVALVSNEVGFGVVPPTPEGRRFRDLQGEANQMLASACSDVVFSLCGLPLTLKGMSGVGG